MHITLSLFGMSILTILCICNGFHLSNTSLNNNGRFKCWYYYCGDKWNTLTLCTVIYLLSNPKSCLISTCFGFCVNGSYILCSSFPSANGENLDCFFVFVCDKKHDQLTLVKTFWLTIFGDGTTIPAFPLLHILDQVFIAHL